ncbi:MAG: polysaccharide export protein [Sphingomonadales bacterium]|nr:polysaccharide export protein [Sphingomonadales bacterium]
MSSALHLFSIRPARTLLAAVFLLLAAPVSAQIDRDSGASAVGADSAPTAVLQDDQRGTIGQSRTLRQDQLRGFRPEPFGSELFNANAGAATAGVMDPNYVVQPGDRVSVTTYGLENQTGTLVVDPEGNIALPNVGPVRVGGVLASQVDDVVSAAASQIYQSTVQVYATVLDSGQILVFVAGPVDQPGSHSGSSQESVIGFLQRAGGIDEDRGSYRHIIIRRNGETIGNIDLYDFLLSGDMSGVQLQTGDVVVVGQQGPIVSVTGDVRAPYTFEFAHAAGTGAELLLYARPRPEVTHVSVLGTRDSTPFNAYVTREEFAVLTLYDGDRVQFHADAPADTFIVRVRGATTGPSAYVVNRGDYLGPLLDRIPLDPLGNASSTPIRRRRPRSPRRARRRRRGSSALSSARARSSRAGWSRSPRRPISIRFCWSPTTSSSFPI